MPSVMIAIENIHTVAGYVATGVIIMNIATHACKINV